MRERRETSEDGYVYQNLEKWDREWENTVQRQEGARVKRLGTK